MAGYKYAELYKQDSVDKQLKIEYDGGTITNEDLYSEEFELVESLCSDTELKFGKCEASSVKFRVANIFSPMIGKQMTISETLAGNTDEPFRIGTYKVYSDVPTADRRYREVTAYDAMYDIINSDVSEWYNSILPNEDSTVTLKEFRTSFIEHFGLEQEEIELVNDSMTVEKTINPSELSGKDVITAICEINGCFGHIGRDGKFHYIYLDQEIQGLYPQNDLYPADDLYPREPRSARIGKNLYITAQYEDFLVKTIDKLQIRQEEDDIGVIVGNGTNAYVVQDNFLVYGKGSEELTGIANNIYEKIRGIIYRPFSADCKGNPCIEVGDAVRLPTKYEIIESYVLKRTLRGIQALRDNLEATGKEYRSTQVNSVHKSIIQLKGKTNVLTRTIEETNSKIVDVESGLSSEIKQNAELIATEVSRATEAEGNLSSKITQTAESITSEVSKTYETIDNAQSTKTALETSIKQTAEGITTELSKQVTETKKYADTAAETAESNAKQDTADKLKDYSTTTEMNTKISASAGEVTSEVSKTLQSYSTTEQMNSAIKQTAEGINTEVAKKVNGDEIISKINQSAEKVSIDAAKINLNGVVTANKNVTIGTDGKITAKDADISGKGTFGSGKIGPWEIADDGLRYSVGTNEQAYLNYNTIILSRADSALRFYPNIIRAAAKNEDGDEIRVFEINVATGEVVFSGDWTLPWE